MHPLPFPVAEMEKQVVLHAVLPVSSMLDYTLHITAAIFLTVGPDFRPKQLGTRVAFSNRRWTVTKYRTIAEAEPQAEVWD